jgi:hypothetical protein
MMTTSKNDKRTFWTNHVKQWRSSGLSQSKYCQKENISFHSFSWWHTRGLKNSKSKEPISFVPAAIKEIKKPDNNVQNDIQLILPNQTKLILPATLALNNLISIVKSLGGLS